MESLKNARTQDLLDVAKARLGLTTDYQLAKRLNWPLNTVTNYRLRGSSMDLINASEFSALTGITMQELAAAARNDRAARGIENRRTVRRAA